MAINISCFGLYTTFDMRVRLVAEDIATCWVYRPPGQVLFLGPDELKMNGCNWILACFAHEM